MLYSTDHTLRHQATFTLRRILGYHEENVIYEKVIQGKAIGMKKHWKINLHVVSYKNRTEKPILMTIVSIP